MREMDPIVIPAANSSTHEKNIKIPTLMLQHQWRCLHATMLEVIAVTTARIDPIIRMMKATFLYFESSSKFWKPLKLNIKESTIIAIPNKKTTIDETPTAIAGTRLLLHIFVILLS